MPRRSSCSHRRRTGSCRRSTGWPAGSWSRAREFPSLTVPPTRAADALGSIEVQWLEPRGRVRHAGRRPGRAHRRHPRGRGEPRRLPHRLPRRPHRAARRHRRPAAHRRRHPGLRRGGCRLRGRRRRLRQRLQVAARGPRHRLRLVRRTRARAHRTGAVGIRGHRRRPAGRHRAAAVGLGAGVHRRPASTTSRPPVSRPRCATSAMSAST